MAIGVRAHYRYSIKRHVMNINISESILQLELVILKPALNTTFSSSLQISFFEVALSEVIAVFFLGK